MNVQEASTISVTPNNQFHRSANGDAALAVAPGELGR